MASLFLPRATARRPAAPPATHSSAAVPSFWPASPSPPSIPIAPLPRPTSSSPPLEPLLCLASLPWPHATQASRPPPCIAGPSLLPSASPSPVPSLRVAGALCSCAACLPASPPAPSVPVARALEERSSSSTCACDRRPLCPAGAPRRSFPPFGRSSSEPQQLRRPVASPPATPRRRLALVPRCLCQPCAAACIRQGHLQIFAKYNYRRHVHL